MDPQVPGRDATSLRRRRRDRFAGQFSFLDVYLCRAASANDPQLIEHDVDPVKFACQLRGNILAHEHWRRIRDTSPILAEPDYAEKPN